jgi:hypothetical protein
MTVVPALPPGPPQHHVVLPGQAPDGEPILAVLLKRSYRIVANGPAERLDSARPLVPGDQHFGDPMNSTVEHESDHVPYKLATDVVVHADAHAPADAPVTELLVSVVVGRTRKDVLVIGDRVAHHRSDATPVFSDPVPFTRMPMRYELAYGGVDVRTDPTLAFPYARNHLGRGFVVANTADAVEGVQLPNMEAPDDRLTPERLCCGHVMHWERQPLTDGLGWYSKYWQPRAGLAGVMPGDRALETQLRREYARVIPPHQRADYRNTALRTMDFAFFNGASRGLVRPYLEPSERVAFRNLHPSGDVIGALPSHWPKISLDIGQGGVEVTRGVLHTATIRLDVLEMDLVWRAAFPYPGLDFLPTLRRLHVAIDEA